jgi:hypothetical protein
MDTVIFVSDHYASQCYDAIAINLQKEEDKIIYLAGEVERNLSMMPKDAYVYAEEFVWYTVYDEESQYLHIWRKPLDQCLVSSLFLKIPISSQLKDKEKKQKKKKMKKSNKMQFQIKYNKKTRILKVFCLEFDLCPWIFWIEIETEKWIRKKLPFSLGTFWKMVSTQDQISQSDELSMIFYLASGLFYFISWKKQEEQCCFVNMMQLRDQEPGYVTSAVVVKQNLWCTWISNTDRIVKLFVYSLEKLKTAQELQLNQNISLFESRKTFKLLGTFEEIILVLERDCDVETHQSANVQKKQKQGRYFWVVEVCTCFTINSTIFLVPGSMLPKIRKQNRSEILNQLLLKEAQQTLQTMGLSVILAKDVLHSYPLALLPTFHVTLEKLGQTLKQRTGNSDDLWITINKTDLCVWEIWNLGTRTKFGSWNLETAIFV